MTKKMHAAGVNHRDYYACHVLVNVITEDSCEVNFEQLRVAVLDLHRAHIRATVPARWLVKDLGSLLFSLLNFSFSKTDWLYFIQCYEGRCLSDVFNDNKVFWQNVVRRADCLQSKAVQKGLTIAGAKVKKRVLV